MTAKIAHVFSLLTIIIVVTHCQKSLALELADPIVATKSGLVRGQINSTVEQGRTFYSFRGIPFAEPPVGNLRFEPPVPKTPWQGILNATNDGEDCVQDDGGSEDCLFLNVYSPQIKPGHGRLLPVMVYLFGGGFSGGSSKYASYGPDYFLDRDVVMVTSNYRLGIFGFLSTGNRVAPGNMGLKDQVLVLHWVKDNIAHFGGNPGQVTLFGQSSGGASVAYHIHSRLSKGLFQRAIIESGVSFSLWAYSRNIEKVVAMVAQNFSIDATVNSSRELVAGLKQVPATVLQAVATAKETRSYLINDPREGLAYAPVLEPEHDGAFQTEASYELMAKGHFNRVPCIIGYNSLEGTFDFSLVFRAYLLKYDALPQTLVPASMNANASAIAKWGIGARIKLQYFGLVPVAASDQTLMEFLSDDQFARPIRQYALLLSRHVPTYFYRFSYMGRLAGWGPGNERPGNGVAHGEEVWYMWRSRFEPSLMDRLTRARMVTMWTNFAKYGNPTPGPDVILQNKIWPKTDGEHTYMDIGDDLVIAKHPQADDMAFWDDVFKTCGRRPYITY